MPWAGFHTLRHTYASRLFAHGANAKQVQQALGHHSPSFTLDTYVHLLPGDAAPVVPLPAFEGVSGVSASRDFEPVRALPATLPDVA